MPKRESSPQQHAGPDHIVSFFQRLRLDWLLLHFPPRLVRSVYVFVNGFITIGVLALLALVSRNPFVFPSLGPTAYLLFFSPLARPQARETLFWPRYWPRLRLCGVRCSQAPEHCRSECTQVSSGQESWQRLFRFRRQAHSWFFSMLAIRPPAPRR